MQMEPRLYASRCTPRYLPTVIFFMFSPREYFHQVEEFGIEFLLVLPGLLERGFHNPAVQQADHDTGPALNKCQDGARAQLGGEQLSCADGGPPRCTWPMTHTR